MPVYLIFHWFHDNEDNVDTPKKKDQHVFDLSNLYHNCNDSPIPKIEHLKPIFMTSD